MRRRVSCSSVAWAVSAHPLVAHSTLSALPRLKISDTHHFLITEDGKPFFWLGDTAWELFHRLNREESDRYLKDRAAKGFNLVQAVALAEFDGLNTPNAYGKHGSRASTR